MSFLDIVLVPVRNTELKAYLAHSRAMSPFFKANGALRVTETWGVDLPDGLPSTFASALELQADETAAIGWITWPDRATRNKAWARLQADNPGEDQPPPFDKDRMVFGGFELVADG